LEVNVLEFEDIIITFSSEEYIVTGWLKKFIPGDTVKIIRKGVIVYNKQADVII